MGLFIRNKENYFSWFTRLERQHVSGEIEQVYLELSTHCNYSCKTCMRNTIPGFSPRHFGLKAMDRLLPMLKNLPRLKRVVLLGFGEPLCNPHFEILLKRLRSIEGEIVLVTNASLFNNATVPFLSELPVDEIWVSRDDSLNDDTQVIRGGADGISFKRNIESLVEIKNKSRRIKKVGLEIVATRMNLQSLGEILLYAASIDIDECIVTNVFPYSELMKDEILYSIFGQKLKPDFLKKLLPRKARNLSVRFPAMIADRPRRCPFMEKGTVFVTSCGETAPCPELAYTHQAFYFGLKRIHTRQIFGSINSKSISAIWADNAFSSFRDSFRYYEYPDCSTCPDPEKCWHRTVDAKDCYWNSTPCGECLWAKDIVICP